MKTYTPRELRAAILLAVVLTTTVLLAFLDPSCQRPATAPSSGPARSLRF